MQPTEGLKTRLTTGRLGAIAGVSADTIRHYEKLGLLPKAPRSDGGYRLYEPSAVIRVQTIRSAIQAGFGLTQLAGIFRERDAGGAPCNRVAALAEEKVESLDVQIRELSALRDWLALTVDAWKKRLKQVPPGKPARLLESLSETPSLKTKHLPKGSSHETARPHFRPVPGRSVTRTNQHGMSHAPAVSKVR